MSFQVFVEAVVFKTVSTVNEHIRDHKLLSKYFTTKSSGTWQAGGKVVWEWEDCQAVHELEVISVSDRELRFSWDASGKQTEVTIETRSENDKTRIKIREGLFQPNEADMQRVVEQTHGWTEFVCCLKAWLYSSSNIRIDQNWMP